MPDINLRDCIEGLETQRNTLQILFNKFAGRADLRSGLLEARNHISRVIQELEQLVDTTDKRG